ncbi:alpha/beta family hydrolase [Novosphingobium kaempferiae]|uniref:alpha/beta family hydrolase n=1 Tax=Novosphingobium kaempferiae TaxID=2896849 RepID=UPI001E56BD96|nr:alpha/beta family hydrolase [Novosphingobium kaempferiae]
MADAGTIIVVGRTDRSRESDAIRRILLRLEAEGYRLHWFESDYIRSYDRMTTTIARRWPSLATWGVNDTLVRRLARVTLRLAMIAGDAHRFDHLYVRLFGQPANNARQLRMLLDATPEGEVHFVTHSAGGISVTRIADHPSVARIACFGYPFQRPGNRPEAFRTAHLPSVGKPLMIVQGDTDPYGSDPAEFRRHLPRDAQVISLACDHDCDGLSHDEFERAWAAVAGFLRHACEPASANGAGSEVGPPQHAFLHGGACDISG